MIRPGILLSALLPALAADAGAALDLVLATPHLARLEAGETVRCAHEGHGDPALGLGADLNETVLLRRTGAAATEGTLDADGAARVLPLDGLSGAPAPMVFPERVTRAVGEATGGSPCCLRNRIKDAMRGAPARGDGLVAFRPFAGDPTRARLGAFADLDIRIAIDETAPGMLRALRAETPDAAFVEEFVIDEDVCPRRARPRPDPRPRPRARRRDRRRAAGERLPDRGARRLRVRLHGGQRQHPHGA